jgi:hypothetical protein
MLSKLQLNRRFLSKKEIVEDEITRIAKVEEMFHDFASWVNSELPDGRQKSLALTNLENAVMWAAKAIATEDTYPEVEVPKPSKHFKKRS